MAAAASATSGHRNHSGVQRLATGERQEYRAHQHKCGERMLDGKAQGMARIDRRQYLRRLDDADQSEYTEHDEP